MSIVVNVDWLENHKPGRNAFYQVFELKPAEGRAVTVTHWGKITPSVEKWNRPVLGGENQIFKGAVRGTKSSAKKKRGYEVVDSMTHYREKDDGWLTQFFGAARAHEIEMAMFYDEIAAEYDALHPTSKPDNEFIGETVKAAPEARPDNWGSW